MNEDSESMNPAGEGDSDSDGDDEVLSLLRTDGLKGKGADVELALANVKETSQHRKVRDRALVASGAAAALLLLIFAAALVRSDGTDLETAADGRSDGTTPRTGATVGGQPRYSGDPGESDTPGTTVATSSGSTPASASVPVVPGASTTTTTGGRQSPGPAPTNPPVIQLTIHADAGSVKAGERAWFTVQVHNSGGEGTYEGNDCGMGHFKVTLAPALASPGQPVSWSGDAGSFAAAASRGGGGLAIGPIIGGQRVGELSTLVACTAHSEQRKLAPGESLTEKVAVDLAALPGTQVAGTYTATAEFNAWPTSAGVQGGDPIRATDSTSLNVTGSVPALPGASALHALASAPSVTGWLGSQTGPFSMQTRYFRGAWEILVLPAQASTDTEILRIRADASGTLIDVRAVRSGSSASDDVGATAPVVGERKLFP